MIKALVAGLAIGGAVVVFADYAFSVPSVHVSYETRNCVTVENYPSMFFGTSNYSCELMPEKFNHVWVK